MACIAHYPRPCLDNFSETWTPLKLFDGVFEFFINVLNIPV